MERKGAARYTVIFLVLAFLFSFGIIGTNVHADISAQDSVSEVHVAGSAQETNAGISGVQWTNPKGSITVCKIIINSDGDIADGSALSGSQFSVPGIIPNRTSEVPPDGVIGTSNFTTPLVFNADIINDEDENDASCVAYPNLTLGSYYYGEETSPQEWEIPKYNDQFTASITSLNDFFFYDSNLFDGNPSNDSLRNLNADGHIFLTTSRPNRTLVVLNQYAANRSDSCQPRTIGYWKQPCLGHFNHENETSMLSYLAATHAMTNFFDDVDNFPGICTVLDPGNPASMEERAKQQMLALWFNVASGKIFLGTMVDLIPLSNSTTVSDALIQAESLINSSPETSKDIADKINNDGSVIVACVPSVCGNGIVENGEQCDDGNTKDYDGCSSRCMVETTKIVASKIVCDNESDLPDWGGVVDGWKPHINANTASDFVRDVPGCHFEKGWEFQWSYFFTPNPGDHVGEAGGGWNTFGPTDENGTAVALVQIRTEPHLAVREVFKDGHLNFTYSLNNETNADNVTAEMYCQDDVTNYDNYDFIFYPQVGGEAYCVAFNVRESVCGNNQTPVTVKTYGEPYYSNGTSEWITSSTHIQLSTTVNSTCPSNTTTFYRVTPVGENNCLNQSACQLLEGQNSWNAYSSSFTINETSCHLIEFFANSTVGNSEQAKKQCAFVDNTPPVTNKTVGEPKTAWEGDNTFYPNLAEICNKEGGIDCWKVTLSTPITLDCKDEQPHPVGHSNVCFNVNLDGDDATNKYCSSLHGNMQNGYCCVSEEAPLTLRFMEESQHNLAFYCEDKLGNKGQIDDEKFKVEGNTFSITLNKKWNLISVPFSLSNDDPEAVFGDIGAYIKSVWTYDPTNTTCPTNWCSFTPDGIDNDDISSMVPGSGYWVLANNETVLTIDGSLFRPAMTPPSKNIVKGWNLIGYYGNEMSDGGQTFSYNGPVGSGKKASCTLGTLVDMVQGHQKWSSLWTYWEVDNPDSWKSLGFSTQMDSGAGYWIMMNADGIYAPSTTC